MTKNYGLIDQVLKSIRPFSKGNPMDEKAAKLEWFVKVSAVEAVNDLNKKEFERILDENNLIDFSSFVYKYVPDFKEKFQKFTQEDLF